MPSAKSHLGLGEVRGAPTLVGRTPAASDSEAAQRLWTLSEELTGTLFPQSLTHTRSS